MVEYQIYTRGHYAPRKVCLFIVLCCLLPLTAYAENKKIVISCSGLVSAEIKQPPPGVPFGYEACGDKCFYIEFIMEDETARRVNTEFNAYKHVTREIYLGDHLLGIAEPFHIDAPYLQKTSTAAYSTLKDAVDEARRLCPNAVIKVPDTVRRL